MKMKSKVNKVFLSIFIPILIIEIVLVLGFTAYIYSEIYSSVEESLLMDKKNYINRIKNSFDLQIQTIEQAFSAYSMTGTFESDMNKPLNYKDYLHIRSVSAELNYISLMGSENAEYSLISIPYHWKITGSTFREMTNSEITNLEESLDKHSNTVFWEPSVNGIQMIMELPILTEKKYSVGIAEMKTHLIQELVRNDEQNPIMILNKDREVLYSAHSDKIHSSNIEMLLNKNDDKIKLDNGDIILLTQSSSFRWVFMTSISQSSVASKVSAAQNGLIFISTCLVLVLGAISFILTRHFLKPFRVISKRLAIDDEGDTVEKIVNQIDSIVAEQRDLSTVLNEQRSELETLFIWNLFRNSLSESEIRENLEAFDYQWIEGKSLYVLLIQIDTNSNEAPNTIQLFALQNLIIEIVNENVRMQPILYSPNTIALILGLDNEMTIEDKESFITKRCSILNKYLQRLKIIAHYGISNEYSHLSDTSRSCQLAKESLRYQYYDNQDLFVFNKELGDASAQQLGKYPMVLENQLFENIRKGMTESVPELYKHLFSEIIKNNSTPLNLKVSISTLLNHLLEFNQLMGLKNSLFRNSQKYDELLSMENIENLREVIYLELVVPLLDSAHTDEQSKSLSEQIIKIIHTQYDQPLSLEIIGDKLNYSSVYLSIVFKKECGENFNDYLQNYRIEVAKKWLKESTITIKEISERLQYTNSQNFIRFFKKKVNMTPGEYRKKNAINNERQN